jgi:glycosyltransferase involved in cell wall biosynthesis
MEKVKVSFFLGSLAIGGTQKNVVNILKNIDREKFEPRLCCLFSGGPFEKEINPLNIPTLICNYGPIYDIRTYLKIIYFFRGSDILHCFGYPTIYFGVLFGWLAGAHIIVAMQDRDVWKKWYHVLLDKLIRPFVDLYIADGKGTMEFAIKQQGINPDKIITIYDGADIEALKPKKTRSEIRDEFGIGNNTTIIGVISRLDDKKKGISYFLKAIPSILEKYSDTRFIYCRRWRRQIRP